MSEARVSEASAVEALPTNGLQPILSCTGVSKSFGGLEVLRSVTFTAWRRRITSVIGPNGSGKTTLLNIVSGLETMDAGTVTFLERRIDRLPAHQRSAIGIGRTFQLVRLFPSLTAKQNVMIGAHRHATAGVFSSLLRPVSTQRENRMLARRAEESLRLVGLAPNRDDTVAASLTITEQRLVELARALVSEPQLLILDEPTGGLDPSRLGYWMARVTALRDDLDLTVLLVEHRMRVVMEISDHVVALHAGDVIAQGAPADVVRDPAVRQVYLGESRVGD